MAVMQSFPNYSRSEPLPISTKAEPFGDERLIPCLYEVYGFNSASNASNQCPAEEAWRGMEILFQRGPIGEERNGITMRSLVAVLMHRMSAIKVAFTNPAFGEEDHPAMDHIESALFALHKLDDALALVPVA